ncbi:methyl-accepting chemotaxis protein [Paenisporosarcina cavernae]|uniref:Methyl-accepting chemotaxis protein n=1 Tax=Paenisporosarcina cavernae TaxID=2320858 RepID=A0A385YUC8_9BACL|nr:methyl-accepting chemotaxis protein [Paenisporosarcina cavernae]AYC30081.1 methyl-accepting chemotaxis protein [Paenisporosarcina cavernae]
MRSVRGKLLSITFILLLVPSLLIGTISYITAKNSLNESGQTMIKNAVTQAIQMIDGYQQQVDAGEITLEEAQEQVKTYLLGEKQADGTRPNTNPIDLGKNGYFVVYDEQGNEVAHPSLEGKNVIDVKDVNGKFLVQEQIKAAQNGGGFVQYSWAFPDNPDRIGEKIMYNDLDPNWGWVVTAGSYMEDFNAQSNSILWILAWTIGISLIVGAVIIYLLSNHLSRPINAVKHQLNRLSENDLTGTFEPFKRKDEIGELGNSLAKMKDNLSAMILRIQEVSHTLAASSEEVTASAEETNRASEQIASSIQLISENAETQTQQAGSSQEAVHEISEGIRGIKDHLVATQQSTETTSLKVAEGKNRVVNTEEKIHDIQEKSHRASLSIQQLGDKSTEIGNIVSLITAVAEQTNLLALNAAIEAARAGEHGKGFAVVAGEIRKLAEQSGNSASQIQELIFDIQNGIEESVTFMKDGEESVSAGILAMNLTGESFNEIEKASSVISEAANNVLQAVKTLDQRTASMVESTAKTAEMIEHSSAESESIAAASEEQSASMQEVAASSAALAKMAEELSGIVAEFKLG